MLDPSAALASSAEATLLVDPIAPTAEPAPVEAGAAPRPHYLLFCEADGGQSAWRFVLEKMGEDCRLAVADAEPLECRERLELLAVVRGLEALDEPSRVTLVTRSRYVNRGLRRGLAEWRASAWQWERFGRLTPVRDHDLWRRVARALEFHRVECRLWRFESESRESTAADARRGDSRRIGALGAARRRLRAAAASLEGALMPSGLAAG